MGLRIIVLSLFVQATAFGIESGSFTFYDGESQIFTTVQQVDRTVLNLKISDLEYEKVSVDGIDQYRIHLPEVFGISRGSFLSSNNSVIPTITRTIAVPFDSEPAFRVTSSNFVELTDIVLAPADEEELVSYSNGDRNMSLNLESNLVIAETAGMMRDVRIYSLTISPVQYDPENSVLRVYSDIEIEVDHAGSGIVRYGNHLSEAFLPIYRSFLDNPLVFDPIEVTRGAYWIIYPDPFLEHIRPIAEWKKAKGYHVEYIAKSDIGSNPSHVAIRDYISARFDSCQIKPDYITIVGDVSMPSGYGIPTRTYNNPLGFGDIESDNYYTFLLGNDYFPDVLIGRISIKYVSDLENYTEKLFTYERTPYIDDTDWYLRGTMVAYWSTGGWYGNFTSPRITKLWCRDRMLESGYIQVDTLFEHPNNYIPYTQINASINNGVSYVNYRGFGDAYGWSYPYYTTSYVNYLTNGPMYPIMTSIVCGTGDYNDYVDECFGEAWIRYPGKGGVGFIGTSNHDAHTRWTNALDVGIYWGLFSEHVTTIAQAQLMGKMTMYDAFPSDRQPNGQIELYFNSYNVLGDPELNCWTGVPRNMSVTHADSVEFGQNYMSVTVTEELGVPLEGAYVCIWKDGELFLGEFTPADGIAEFAAGPDTDGEMAVTVTARDFTPYEGTVTYFNSEITVGYNSHTVDDNNEGESSGNGDGICSPSEVVELDLILENYGQSETAIGVTAEISTDNSHVEIVRATAGFADIAPGESSQADMSYLIEIGPDISNGTSFDILISISDGNSNNWESIIQLPIEAAELAMEELIIQDDDNGMIDPGESVELVITLENVGAQPIAGATAILRTSDDQVTIMDSTALFGDCAPGEMFDNDGDTFMVMAESDIYVGHLINFTLEFEGEGPQIVTSAFAEQVGSVSSRDPIGPDDYGYYCFDNTDLAYSDGPVYDWISIDTQNWDYVTLGDDDVETISLPFDVQYYGQRFSEITICDNGFVALGESPWNAWYNTSIPAPQNASAMIAPFWDDFNQSNLRVYHHYDTDNSRFIIGWNNAWDEDVLRNQTFEIILLDRIAWPTATGDNEIIFQYYLAQSTHSMSAGICSPDRRDGIGYVFNGDYADGAATLSNGRAIKFTTGSQYPTDIDEGRELPESFSLSQNHPNPFNLSTLIDFSISGADHVKLEIFNVLGQKVAILIDGHLDAGFHRITWNADEMNTGIYFYKLETGDLTETKRMLLLK